MVWKLQCNSFSNTSFLLENLKLDSCANSFLSSFRRPPFFGSIDPYSNKIFHRKFPINGFWRIQKIEYSKKKKTLSLTFQSKWYNGGREGGGTDEIYFPIVEYFFTSISLFYKNSREFSQRHDINIFLNRQQKIFRKIILFSWSHNISGKNCIFSQ